MAAKSNNAVSSVPSADQFIAEYMSRKLNASDDYEAPKRSILDRLTLILEDTAVDAVANSTRFAGRITAAASAAGDGYEQAKVLEHKRQAQLMAQRLGLK